MFGLAVLGSAVVYFAVLITVTLLAYRWAARRGLPRGKRWLAAAGGFLLVYLPVFWDHIPTLIVHKYYCEKEAGFWVYKTVDQWKAENPGVIETLDSRLEIKLYDPHTKNRFWTTQRFYTDVTRASVFHAVGRTEEVFADAVTHQTIARSVNFFRGKSGNAFATGGGLDDARHALILGLGNRECGKPSTTDHLHLFRYEFQRMGEGK